MNRILILIVCVLLLAVLAVPAFAAGTLPLTPSSNTVYRGDRFTVAVSVSGVGEYKLGGIEVEYDTSKFELVEGSWKLTNSSYAEFDVADRTGTYILSSSTKLSGRIFVFTFKAKSDAKFNEPGKISVTLTLGMGEETVVNETQVTVTCKHDYTPWTPSETDTESHTHKCNICGKEESQPHTYDNLCDVDCNDCGAVRVTEHVFAEEWISDRTGHWHTCVHCGVLSEVEEHVPGAAAGEYTDQICTVCQFVLNSALGHTHSYDGTYKTDDVFHWTKCIGCGATTEQLRHIFESDCDESCDTCGYKRRVVHNISQSWSSNDDSHWRVCMDCGLTVESGEHIWTDATVILEPTESSKGKMHYHCGLCTAEKMEDIPVKESSGNNSSWWLWLLIGVFAGAAVTLIISAVIALTTSKKHKGRYSH